MNIKNRVLITQKIPSIARELMEKEGLEVISHEGLCPLTPDELSTLASQSIAVISMLSDKLDGAFFEANKHLKVVSNFAVGTNNIDVSKATEKGILVGNTPDVLTEATAETALGLMIACSRNFKAAEKNAIQGEWKKWEPMGFLGHALHGKTLGVIGHGRIGKRFAEMCVGAFKMNVLTLSSKNIDTDLENLLRHSDFISLHTPLNDRTRKLLSTKEFALMKPNCILVNTGRGELIDQDALYDALKTNKIFAAGLDVTEPEPLPRDHKLFTLDNCMILPHIGSATHEARTAMAERAAKNIINGLMGNKTAGFFIN